MTSFAREVRVESVVVTCGLRLVPLPDTVVSPCRTGQEGTHECRSHPARAPRLVVTQYTHGNP